MKTKAWKISQHEKLTFTIHSVLEKLLHSHDVFSAMVATDKNGGLMGQI